MIDVWFHHTAAVPLLMTAPSALAVAARNLMMTPSALVVAAKLEITLASPSVW